MATMLLRLVASLCLLCMVLSVPTEPVEVDTTTSQGVGQRFSLDGFRQWFSQSTTRFVGGGPDKKKVKICEASDWRKASMKLLKEVPATGLFQDLKGTDKWELSGTAIVDEEIYMIFDNLHHIGRAGQRIQYLEPKNVLIESDAPDTGDDSSFESIEYCPDTGTFLMTREAIAHPEKEGVWRASLVEVKVPTSGAYSTVRECPLDYDFSSENKGIEGGSYVAKDGKRYFLGLCEGNYCKGGDEGREPGNGRIIVSSFVQDGDKCMWDVEKVINLPKTLQFQDYADVAILGKNIAIVSQEEAAVWIGDFDIDALDVKGPGNVYHFPRDPECDAIYCNIEGISFIDEYRIVAASDRSKATQHYNCVPHDQSVMIFQLPEPLKPGTKSDDKDASKHGTTSSEM
mmetsp:Transcript_38680/g.75582  ORF Transcript_38680/g.75582 Transcript_38680/m.75582 type:complete len:400 (-) Transcript_38680:211-1410(-)